MASKRKMLMSVVNTEGWMMSYADMATILLAMFIVLSTLGKDQTGASLQKGLESYRASQQNFGLPGFFETSRQPNAIGFEMSGPPSSIGGVGPHYIVESAEKPNGKILTHDQEQENMQRFVRELGRQFDVQRLPQVTGQATLDIFDPFNKAAPYLTSKQKDLLAPIVPLLRRGDYRVVMTVWAPMAKESAVLRSSEQAAAVAGELATTVQLDAAARRRLTAVSQTWHYADFDRPVFSLRIFKTRPTP